MIHKIIYHDFKYLGLVVEKEYSETEIEEINEMNREKINRKNKSRIDNLNKFLLTFSKSKIKKIKKHIWNPRPYQQEIIEKSIEELEQNHKIYIELATGGGKSFIVFNILKYFKPEVIVIFSPRKKINEQNMNDKYLSLLDDEYAVFNMSSSKSPDRFFSELGKKIIICCS